MIVSSLALHWEWSRLMSQTRYSDARGSLLSPKWIP